MSTPWSWPPPTNNAGSSDIANESSVPGATVTDALNDLQTTEQALELRVTTLEQLSTPYIDQPRIPDAFDDEFDAGSPDFAVRGYTIIDATTGVVQTRSGDVNPWGANPAAGTYFSTIVGSWILIQAPTNIQLDIYKTIALAAGDTYFVRMCGTYCLAPAANGHYNEVGLYAAAGALLDNNNRVFQTVRDDVTAQFLQFDTSRVTGGVTVGANGRVALGGHDIRGVRFNSGTNHNLFIVDSISGQPKTFEVSGAPVAANLVRFGIRNLFTASGGSIPQIWQLDFIRKKTGNAWLIP